MSSSSPRLAVIIPVYKVEPYLRQCLDSVCAQTFTAMKIILVDDGSPDACGAICDEYAQRDPRIHVVHTPNQGVSEARNEGLRLIGECPYFTFIDSDDWLESTIYAEAVGKLEEDEELDIVQFGYRYVLGDHPRDISTETLTLRDRDSVCKQFVRNMDNPISTAIWSKVYRTATFQGLSFRIGCHYGEDLSYTLEALYRTRRIMLLSTIGINYRELRDGSLTAHHSVRDISPMLSSLEQLIEDHQADPQFVGYANALLINQLWHYWSMLNTLPDRYRELTPRYIPFVERARRRPLPNVFLGGSHYRKRRLFLRFPKLYMGIRAWLRRRHRKH